MQTAVCSLLLAGLLLTLIFFFCFCRKSSADCNSKPPKAPGPGAERAELARAITKQEGEWELMTAAEGCGLEGGASLLMASNSHLLLVPGACL